MNPVMMIVAVAGFVLMVLGGYVALRRPRAVCYRCGVRLKKRHPYMGLDYCFICREVVVAMAHLVGRDAPYGFPGAQGYLKEENHGRK
jgi:hypothetical protein